MAVRAFCFRSRDIRLDASDCFKSSTRLAFVQCSLQTAGPRWLRKPACTFCSVVGRHRKWLDGWSSLSKWNLARHCHCRPFQFYCQTLPIRLIGFGFVGHSPRTLTPEYGRVALWRLPRTFWPALNFRSWTVTVHGPISNMYPNLGYMPRAISKKLPRRKLVKIPF